MLPTDFKFRVNLYIKTILSKTRENLRLKTRYLKGITTEQLFIISIQEIILIPLYFIQLLNINENKQDTLFLFCFSLLCIFSFFNYHEANSLIIKQKGKKYLSRYMGGDLPQAGCCHGGSMRWLNVEVLEQNTIVLVLMLLLLLETGHLMSHHRLPL